MRLITFTDEQSTRIGILQEDQIVDLSAAAPDIPSEMVAFLEAGDAALEKARAAADTEASIKLSDVTLESPVLRPPKILAVGLNYREHVEETGRELPKVPIIFNKQSTSATGPFAPILRPHESVALDYEGEMGVVIGKRCRRVPKDRYAEVVAGYTVLNDVTIRDWQIRSPTMTMGKSWDSHCPMGPSIVTPDEVDISKLGLKTLVNGDVRQQSDTSYLIFDVPTLIEHLSTAFTLEPGDVIATGTCAGVAAAMEGQPWLKNGDVVRVEIESLGAIENKVVDDKGGVVIE
ncbi:MAG: fumarylacetoacetate hydrolase family protein [Parvibaculaceae bacterium]|nr:fumarylacetoacetate hydrolase family protein [Parvibaculaceae bacterium]HBM87375.1 FAA hydrolase family protein [Rhodobiaceae bacterium]